MKIIKSKDIEFIPASHEDPQNPGVWKKVLFKKDDIQEGRIQMINWSKLPPGKSFKAHYHEALDELFIILNGKANLQINNDQAQLQEGDAALIPMKHTHKMTNTSDIDVFFIALGISHNPNGKTIITE